MNPAEWLARSAARAPSSPALFRGRTLVSDYAGFAASAASIAGALRARGLGPGARVAMFAKNATEYLEAVYGGWWAGITMVPVNAKLHPREAAWILADSGASLAFTSPGAAAELAGLAPGCELVELGGPEFEAMKQAAPMAAAHPSRADDLIWLFYTSGTTGAPKGVMLESQALTAMALSYFVDVDEVRSGDAALYAAPMSHGAGIYNLMHVMRGARHVVPESGGFDAAEIFGLAADLGDVHMFAAPTMIRRMTDFARATGATGEGVRTVVYGGGPMYVADIIEAVEAIGPRFVQIYGQGECPMAITALSREEVADRSHPRWRERLASVGRAQSAVRVMIGDADGRELPPGEIGEIMAQGLPVMRGYWNNEKATASTLVDGWLRTGDMGALDEDGYLTLHDRSKDVIISGGTNIYPREVEEALLTHEAVREVAVVGRVNEEWGEEVIAFVSLHEGAAADVAELDRWLLDRIARFKRPKAWFFEPELPKNNYGKIVKTELRDRLKSL